MTNDESVIKKLQQIQTLVSECLVEVKCTKKPRSAASTSEVHVRAEEETSIIDMVNKIKDCDESDNIGKKVLDQSDAGNRILLALYICSKYFPHRRLSTGEIAKITSELGVKIMQPNVSRKITNSLLKYLDSDSVRKTGKASLYKLNRKGVTYFESIIN